MKFAAWNEREQEALAGLPWMQRCLYMALRWRMNHRTGRVGDECSISYQALAEDLYVEPVQGRHEAGSPSIKALRCALEQLQKAGLVRSCGSREVLVFLLPLAGISARPKKEGQMKGRDDGQRYQQPETVDLRGFTSDLQSHDGQTENGNEGHTSDIRVNPLSVETTSSSDRPVDNFRDRMMMPLTAGQMVDLVAWLERKRGKQSPLVASDSRLASWQASRVTGTELSEAHRIALAQRASSRCEAPVNAGFLDSILRSQVLSRRSASREAKRNRGGHWYDSPEGIAAMADKVGLVRESGETLDIFRFRINDVLIQREKAARRTRKAN